MPVSYIELDEAQKIAVVDGINRDIEGLVNKTRFYVDGMYERSLNSLSGDEEKIINLQQALGSAGVLLRGQINGIRKAALLSPSERWGLYEHLCKVWLEQCVKYGCDKFQLVSKKDICYEGVSVVWHDAYHDYAGCLELFALLDFSNFMKLTKDIFTNPFHDSEENKHISLELYLFCLRLILPDLQKSTDFIDQKVPLADRKFMLDKIKESTPKNEVLAWFDADGNVTEFSQQWVSVVTLEVYWSLVCRKKFSGNFDAFYVSKHPSIMQFMHNVSEDTLRKLDDFSFEYVGRFLLANLKSFLKNDLDERDGEWIHKIYMLSKQYSILFSVRFNHANDSYQFASDKYDHLYRDLIQVMGFFNRQGKVEIPVGYLQEDTGLKGVWSKSYKMLGYASLEDFFLSDSLLVTFHCDKNNFEVRWNKQYSSEAGYIPDESELSVMRPDLDLLAEVVKLRLDKREDLSDEIRQSYRFILSQYAYKFKHAQYLAYLELYTSTMHKDDLADKWVKQIIDAGSVDLFCLQTSLDSELTAARYFYHNHCAKSIIAEVVLARLEHNLKFGLDDLDIKSLLDVLDKFLQTRFVRKAYVGIHIGKLKEKAIEFKKILTPECDLDRQAKRVSLTQQRQYGGSLVLYAHNDFWDDKLNLNFYNAGSFVMQAYLAEVAYIRLHEYVSLHKQSDIGIYDLPEQSDRAGYVDILFAYCGHHAITDEQLNHYFKLLLKVNKNGDFFKSDAIYRPSAVSNLTLIFPTYESQCLAISTALNSLKVVLSTEKVNIVALSSLVKRAYKEILLLFNCPRLNMLYAHYNKLNLLENGVELDVDAVTQKIMALYSQDKVDQWLAEALIEQVMGKCFIGESIEDYNLKDVFTQDEIFEYWCRLVPVRMVNVKEVQPFVCAYAFWMLNHQVNTYGVVAALLVLVDGMQQDLDVLAAAKDFFGFDVFYSAVDVTQYTQHIDSLMDEVLALSEEDKAKIYAMVSEMGFPVEIFDKDDNFSCIAQLANELKNPVILKDVKTKLGAAVRLDKGKISQRRQKCCGTLWSCVVDKSPPKVLGAFESLNDSSSA
jgi:hypothetical protein